MYGMKGWPHVVNALFETGPADVVAIQSQIAFGLSL
jgi:hypothetical protein